MSELRRIPISEMIEFVDSFLLLPSESMAKPIVTGKLEDGRKYQIQLIITTDESEFIDE